MKNSVRLALLAAFAAQPLVSSAFGPDDHMAWIKANQGAKPQFVDGDTITYAKAELIKPFTPAEYQDIQIFEGMVIGLHRGGLRSSFTVRKVSFGQGVERIFPLHSPTIAKVDLVRSARVRRAKLYFLRGLKGKAARMKETKRA